MHLKINGFHFYCGGNWGLAINKKNRYGYTALLFQKMNLRKCKRLMDKRLNKSYVPENIWGYRFLDYRELCISTNRRYINWGAIIEDKGYMGVGLVKSSLKKNLVHTTHC